MPTINTRFAYEIKANVKVFLSQPKYYSHQIFFPSSRVGLVGPACYWLTLLALQSIAEQNLLHKE